jgi:hypothetical protein
MGVIRAAQLGKKVACLSTIRSGYGSSASGPKKARSKRINSMSAQNPAVSRLASPAAAATPLNSDQVWVDTKSGKYWKPGSRFDGKTKKGEYLTEEDAVQKGYRPANGRENDYGCE